MVAAEEKALALASNDLSPMMRAHITAMINAGLMNQFGEMI